MKTKQIIFFSFLFLLILSPLINAEILDMTAPSNNEKLTIGSTYELEANTDGITADPSINCTFTYWHLGKNTSVVTLGVVENGTKFNMTVPNSFGTNIFLSDCTNGTVIYSSSQVSLNNYAAGETAEVFIDGIVLFLVFFVSFATLIGLVLLFGWMKKKF